MKNKKDKRAFLLGEETLKIIIAVIAIGLLAFLLFKLYFSGKQSEELGQAQASLDYFIKEIGNGATTVEIYNPEGWYISSWPINNLLPTKCASSDRCVCICEGADTVDLLSLKISEDFAQSAADRCDENGVCDDYSGKIVVEPTKIKAPSIFTIKRESAGVAVEERDGP